MVRTATEQNYGADIHDPIPADAARNLVAVNNINVTDTLIAQFGGTRVVCEKDYRELYLKLKGLRSGELRYSACKEFDGQEIWIVPINDVQYLEREHPDLHAQILRCPESMQHGTGQYANHTCCKHCRNAKIEVLEYNSLPVVVVRTTKPILKGQQILVEYSKDVASHNFPGGCRCCKCRGACPQ